MMINQPQPTGKGTAMKIEPAGSNMTEIEAADGTTVLFSYTTPVAAFIPGVGFIKTEKTFSVTTTKHINKWIKKNGSPESTVTSVSQEMIEELVNVIGREC
jgi:hypothetical protein